MSRRAPFKSRQEATLVALMRADAAFLRKCQRRGEYAYVRGGRDPRPDDVRVRTTGLRSLSPYDPDFIVIGR